MSGNDICDITDLDREICAHCRTESPVAPTDKGMYADVPNDVYHADRNSLSSSQARRLLRTCPAQFKYELDHPRTTSTDYFDLGTVTHTLTFGVGPEIEVINAKDWRKAESQKLRQQAWDEGKTPMLPHEFAHAKAMAKSLKAHPIVAEVLSRGVAERSLYAPDPETGVLLRARPDWMDDEGQRLILADGKTAESADPDEFAWSAYKFGYAEQAAWYRTVARLLGYPDPVFLFFIVSKHAPYLVSVVELTPDAIAYGERRNRRAIDLFAQCRAFDSWPSWHSDVHLVELPSRAYYLEEDQ